MSKHQLRKMEKYQTFMLDVSQARVKKILNKIQERDEEIVKLYRKVRLLEIKLEDM